MKKHLSPPILTAAFLTAIALPVFAGQPVIEDKKAVAPVEEPDIVVHPLTDPYFNEDSFITTDARAWYLNQRVSGGQPLGPGTVQVAALELRIRLTSFLQLVANKDGYTDIHTVGYKKGGWNNIAAGLKWQFVNQKPMHLTAAFGVGYEFPTGDEKALQEYDELRFWLSVDKYFGKLHLGVNGGYHIGLHDASPLFQTSDFLDWHVHADYEVCKWFSPVVEFNGYHTTSEGKPATPFSGQDAANISGNYHGDVVTFAVGAEVRPLKHFALRGAWEIPVTDNVQLIDHRWTFSAVYSF